MPLLAVPGCRLRYQIEGPDDGPVLLLSNSLGSDLSMWQPQVPALTHVYRVLRYDTRGHGESDVPPGPYTLESLGRDAVALLDGLGIARAHFCGLSLGGMVGMWLGMHAPQRVQHLILANTSAKLGPPAMWDDRIRIVRSQGLEPISEGVLARWFTPGFHAASAPVVERCRRMLLNTPAEGYASCCAAIRDMDQANAIAGISNPTLVVIGRDDPSTPPAQGALVANRIPGARTVTLRAAHLSNIEAASAFNEAVLTFLTGSLGDTR